VNQGFDRLRQYVRLPGLSKKKLSKVDTLRAAVVYIKHLQSLLAQTDVSHHIDGQLSSQQQSQYHQQQQQQQQQPAAAVDNTACPAPSFLFLSLLQTGVNSPTASYDVAPAISGLLTPPEPAPRATYSTESACLPLMDVNDNYAVAELCPISSQDASADEQQRRLNELTAWLMQ